MIHAPITKHSEVKALPITGKDYLNFVGEPKGFAVKVAANGTKTYVFDYRITGRQRRITIGSCDDWTLKAAEAKARRLRVQVDQGDDPLADREAQRRATDMTELADEFEKTHLPRRRPSTAAGYRSILKDIRAAFGRRKVADIQHEDIERLHRKISATAPGRANQVAAVLSKMFSIAVKKRMRPDHPVRGLERNPTQKRERYLSADELARLTTALAEAKDQQTANFVRLLLLSGCRRGELLTATWDQFDLAEGTWTKPATNTKQNKLHRVPLSPPAREILTRLRETSGTAHVFTNDQGQALNDINRDSWAALLKAAGIRNFRLHDLRHSYASFLVSSGFSLPMIGALLGHSAPATTARYAHLADDPLRKATDSVGALVQGVETGTKAQVLPIRGGGRGTP